MSSPSRRTRPVIRPLSESSCIRFRVRRKVDLPQPDGPISAWTRLAGNPSETFFTAVNLPYMALSFAVSNTTGPSTGLGWRSVSRLRACPERSERVTSDIERRPAVDRQSGAETQDEDHENQHQRRCPGELVPFLVGTGGVVEDCERQCRHRLIQVKAQVLAPQRGEEQRRSFTGDARCGQQGSGGDAG